MNHQIQKIKVLQFSNVLLQFWETLRFFTYFINNYNLIAIDSSKHQTLNAYQKGIQQISSTGILDHATILVVIFIIEEFKETVLDFSHGAISLL